MVSPLLDAGDRGLRARQRSILPPVPASIEPPGPGRETAAPRPRATLGTDPWREVAGLGFSHWDLWFALVCVLDHGGDWDLLGAALEDRGQLFERDSEAKRSHLDDLSGRLGRSGLRAEQLAAPVLDEQRLRAKARTKVMKQEVMARERTAAMVNTPRVRLRERALRGSWGEFPISPAAFYEEFASEVDARPSYGERATMHLARRLEAIRATADRAAVASSGSRLGLHRALLTAGYEAGQRADDSSGDLGRLLSEMWRTYAAIPWTPAGIDARVYYGDLCQMVIWDDFSSLYKIEEVPFQAVSADDTELVDEILTSLASELASVRLRHHAQQARQARAWLRLAQGELDRFVPIAAELGSEHWIPIERMAQAALERGRPDIAEAVFSAADQPGFHQQYLRERQRELMGPLPRPHRPRLSVLG
jgi:hypothetical protein